MINMWLDDVRPAPEGWLHVYTVEDAIKLIKSGQVQKASLDHDLGLCSPCKNRDRCANCGSVYHAMSNKGWYCICCDKFQPKSRNCQCMTGYKLCLWMAENNRWPKEKPVVHSANPVGAFAMRQIIDRYFPTEEQ